MPPKKEKKAPAKKEAGLGQPDIKDMNDDQLSKLTAKLFEQKQLIDEYIMV